MVRVATRCGIRAGCRAALRPSTDKLRRVSSRRALPLVLAVSALLAVTALAAHGRPIGRSHGAGPTPAFFDYVFTTAALIAGAIAIVFVWSLAGGKWSKPGRQRGRMNLVQLVAMLCASLLLGWALAHAHLHFRPKSAQSNSPPTRAAKTGAREPVAADRRNARLRWDEVAIVAALLAAAGVAMFATRRTRPAKEWRFRSHEEIAVALDESLDDLRTEPDVRRAIIAAYARMEHALGAAGLPRRPAEAPLEYLARALHSLDASAPAVTRLTDLFERAKFSQHEPDESMRAEAIGALVAVRDELRAPVAVAA
jgi:Domain of unknown function (DUF4129)